MKFKFLFLCVLYRKSPEMSSTLSTIANIETPDKSNILVIWNNDAIQVLDTKTELFGVLGNKFEIVDVINAKTNQSLATIYNKIYEKYSNVIDAFCILDDDSILSPNYIKACVAKLDTPAIKLFLPVVYHGDIIVSPAQFDGRRYDKINIGVMPARQIRAIASGMIIPAKTLDQFKFDENFVFYGADTEYILRIAQDGGNVCIIDTEIQHALSTETLRRTPFSNFKFSSLLQSFGLIGILYGKRHVSLYKIMRLSLRQVFFSKKLLPLWLGIKMCSKVILRSM